MNNDKTKQQILFDAARLIHSRQEVDYYRAKMRAGRKICGGWVKQSLLPTDTELRNEVQRFVSLYEGDRGFDNLLDLRLTAWRMMNLLEPSQPILFGGAVDGEMRSGGQIQILIDASALDRVLSLLDRHGLFFEQQSFEPTRSSESVRVLVKEKYPVELIFRSGDWLSSEIEEDNPKEAEANLEEFQEILRDSYPDFDPEFSASSELEPSDRFEFYRLLLLPLESVEQNKHDHPEGDALYHSLQVFEQACARKPYDEEFLLAAILHDVGLAVDPMDPARAGLDVLDGWITERTAWFIENLQDAQRAQIGVLGARALRRLQKHLDYEDLTQLAECDLLGRTPGADVRKVTEALSIIRELARDELDAAED
ncbi:tRNA adenylyltransferase [Thalassoglobus sp. JC818]|uniref:tRNA adenylyltransferase n=1 Tax=Thalassoglobus sp. JC818 TaxID=3232136 RepID=UPI00345960C6